MHYTPSTIPAEAVDALRPAFDYSDVIDSRGWVDRCMKDLAQLWRHDDCWAVTEIQRTKHGLAAHIAGLAGPEPDGVIAEIEEWARDLGCKKIYYTGRRGWLRTRPDYKLRCVTAEKEI